MEIEIFVLCDRGPRDYRGKLNILVLSIRFTRESSPVVLAALRPGAQNPLLAD